MRLTISGTYYYSLYRHSAIRPFARLSELSTIARPDNLVSGMLRYYYFTVTLRILTSSTLLRLPRRCVGFLRSQGVIRTLTMLDNLFHTWPSCVSASHISLLIVSVYLRVDCKNLTNNQRCFRHLTHFTLQSISRFSCELSFLTVTLFLLLCRGMLSVILTHSHCVVNRSQDRIRTCISGIRSLLKT